MCNDVTLLQFTFKEPLQTIIQLQLTFSKKQPIIYVGGSFRNRIIEMKWGYCSKSTTWTALVIANWNKYHVCSVNSTLRTVKSLTKTFEFCECSFGALTLLVGWHQVHPTCKNCSSYPQKDPTQPRQTRGKESWLNKNRTESSGSSVTANC